MTTLMSDRQDRDLTFDHHVITMTLWISIARMHRRCFVDLLDKCVFDFS